MSNLTVTPPPAFPSRAIKTVKYALIPPSRTRRFVWWCFGRCPHRYYPWNYSGPGILCGYKKGHKGSSHRSIEGVEW